MKTDQVKANLDATWQLILRNLPEEQTQVLASNDPALVKQRINKVIPVVNSSFTETLADFEKEILPFLNHNPSPKFGAYITGSGNKVAAIAEFIKAYYNQNGLKWNNSPIASELEQLVIEWISTYCKVPDHHKGILTSGGSMSNLMAIHFAIASRFPERELKGIKSLPNLTIYCSDQTHSSIDRALVFLGLGRNCLRKIPSNETFQIDMENLKKTLEIDIANGFLPFMLIGNAGTTNTGSIDPLEDLGKISEYYQLWFHIDGAYGLPAIQIPELRNQFNGINKADSIIINPHKWMYVPFEASAVLLREIPEAIHFSPDYLFTENPGERWESSSHTIELSKEFRALKIWFTMKYFGVEQLTSFVKWDIELTAYLAGLLDSIPFIKVEPTHPLSILCFKYHNPQLSFHENELVNITAIREIESQGKIFITGTKLRNEHYLRVYFGNPERTKKDVEYMVKVIKKTIENVRSSLSI